MALPKTVFVKEERDGKEKYLVADYKAYDLAETDLVEIGEYTLVRRYTARLVAELKPKK